MFSYGVDDEIVTPGLRERVRVMPTFITVILDSNETLKDHVDTLEYKVYEHLCDGTLKERISTLEWELGILDDMASLGLLKDERGMFDLFSLPEHDVRSDSDNESVHYEKRPKTNNMAPARYNILQ